MGWGRRGAAAAAMGGRLYVIGGYCGEHLNTAEVRAKAREYAKCRDKDKTSG